MESLKSRLNESFNEGFIYPKEIKIGKKYLAKESGRSSYETQEIVVLSIEKTSDGDYDVNVRTADGKTGSIYVYHDEKLFKEIK